MKQIIALFVALAGAVASTPREPQFIDSGVAAVSAPTSLAWSPDGRLFVAMKARGVGIVENGRVRTPLFATFPALYTGSECGVLGVAFDPDFSTNRYVYVFVTVSAAEQQIVRFTDEGGVGTNRTLIIGGLPTRGRNHNGGAIGFGPDGKLYWAIGDNGIKRGVDGDLTSFASKVCRANPDGSVPDDNPFNDGAGPNNDYIWATGFRNPFTMTFHPVTGELWLNVVGSTAAGQTVPHTTAGYEQAFVIHAGDDGGYDDYEGNQPDAPRFTTPFPRPSVKPRIQYKTGYPGNSGLARMIAHAAPDESGRLLVDFTATHLFRAGEAVVLSGAGQYDGANVVQAVTSPTQIALTLPDGEAGDVVTGRVDEQPQGVCIVGGCFYDGAALPERYAGNFFYGDLTGRIMRAQLDATGHPRMISVFAEGAAGVTDIAAGPDGALYYSMIGGAIRKLRYVETPDVLVAPARVALVEGGRATLAVRLAAPPATPTTLYVRRAEREDAGHHIEVLAGAALEFTAENWNRTQAVVLTAPADADTLNETATFVFHAPRYRTATVAAGARDVNLPELVYSTSALTLDESGTANLAVSLSAAPATSVTAYVRRVAGPLGRVRVAQGAALTFTPENWNVPAPVQLAGVNDRDTDPATVDLQWVAAGFRPKNLRVSVVDDDPRPPVFLTRARSRTVAGLPYAYAAAVRALPAAVFSLVVAPEGMTVNPDTGLVAWTPPARGDFPVTLRATNSRGSVAQSFVLAVASDIAPSAFIFEPGEGATISGSDAEFWGASLDDSGTWKAEFYIDGVLASTDARRGGLYEFGGARGSFDTTALANGAHVLRLVVTDDAGQTGEAAVTVNVAN